MGNFDESEMSRFGSPTFGEDIKGSRVKNLKSVSPWPWPQVTTPCQSLDSHLTVISLLPVVKMQMEKKEVLRLGSQAELALVLSRAEAAFPTDIPSISESEAWEKLEKP